MATFIATAPLDELAEDAEPDEEAVAELPELPDEPVADALLLAAPPPVLEADADADAELLLEEPAADAFLSPQVTDKQPV